MTIAQKNLNKSVIHTVTVAAQRKCGRIILHYRECASCTGVFLLARGLGGHSVKCVGVCMFNKCITEPVRSVTSSLGKL